MKEVIIEVEKPNVVMANDTKEFKTYIMDTGFDCYVLKKCNPVGNMGKKWAWMHLLIPNQIGGIISHQFYKMIEYGATYYNVFELESISDLLEFLKDREELYIMRKVEIFHGPV